MQLPEEIKGWQLFLEVRHPPVSPSLLVSHTKLISPFSSLQENAIARQDGDGDDDDEYFKVTQRRQLVSRWAVFPQADRDGYQARGTRRGRERWHHSGESLGRGLVSEGGPGGPLR